jgi:hypothetical protein
MSSKALTKHETADCPVNHSEDAFNGLDGCARDKIASQKSHTTIPHLRQQRAALKP